MRRLLERILSLLWTSVAVLLIGGAALVTLVRMLLPQIGEQRSAVETWLTDIVGRPVEVGAISANWSGWAPRLTFDRLVILDERRQADPGAADLLAPRARAGAQHAPSPC